MGGWNVLRSRFKLNHFLSFFLSLYSFFISKVFLFCLTHLNSQSVIFRMMKFCDTICACPKDFSTVSVSHNLFLCLSLSLFLALLKIQTKAMNFGFLNLKKKCFPLEQKISQSRQKILAKISNKVTSYRIPNHDHYSMRLHSLTITL